MFSPRPLLFLQKTPAFLKSISSPLEHILDMGKGEGDPSRGPDIPASGRQEEEGGWGGGGGVQSGVEAGLGAHEERGLGRQQLVVAV